MKPCIEKIFKRNNFIKTKNIFRFSDNCYYASQVPYKRIFGNTGRLDFVLNIRGTIINIEVKYQKSSGSVYEKFPTIYHEIKESQYKNWFVIAKGESEGLKDITKGRNFLIRKTKDFDNVKVCVDEEDFENSLQQAVYLIERNVVDYGKYLKD